MTHKLHLTPADIEARLARNIAMYRDDPRPLPINQVLAEHWTDCLHKFQAYQEGRIGLAELPSDVLSMGWVMPAWGYRRD